jgi:hypothetical protein
VAPRARWWHHLQASKQEALLAVDPYNQSNRKRRLEGFVVHMHVARLAHLTIGDRGFDTPVGCCAS